MVDFARILLTFSFNPIMKILFVRIWPQLQKQFLSGQLVTTFLSRWKHQLPETLFLWLFFSLCSLLLFQWMVSATSSNNSLVSGFISLTWDGLLTESTRMFWGNLLHVFSLRLIKLKMSHFQAASKRYETSYSPWSNVVNSNNNLSLTLSKDPHWNSLQPPEQAALQRDALPDTNNSVFFSHQRLSSLDVIQSPLSGYQAVSHQNTILAQCCRSSVFKREPMFPTNLS